ncbi:MAG TPA: sugar phosphate isomerase/epimerase family protein, partial [Caldilineaceae bacterium]|nr:sugar phosphate isomerase/epimerase family protein [Caldilineaceae bacterium]
MKLSVSMWSVVQAVRDGRIDLSGFIDFAARQQVAGVELLDYFWKDEASEIAQVKRQVQAAGLTLAVYSIGNDFFQPDAEQRARQLAGLKHGVDVANQLEVDRLRVFSGNAKAGYQLEDGLSWIIEGLAQGAAYAQNHGVTLALENHGLMAGRSDQVRGVIEAVNSPALRANLDTGNFLLVGQN